MGNRDKRGREKKKPKKTEIKPPSGAPRASTVWRPVTPTPPPTETSGGEKT